MRPRFSAANPAAEKVRVLYTTEGVIYEGMPVCYDYDATLNIDGYDNTDGAGTETDEGHQNEGKFNRVEAVSAANLPHFAGVVAGSDKHGVTGNGATWIDIYVPNGAIVPVRCDVDVTTGVTILAITSGETELGFIAADSRAVAVAMETEDALGTTADITLAKLDPSLFDFNYGTSAAAYTVTPGTYPVSYKYVEFTSTAPVCGFIQDNRLLSDAAVASGQLTVSNNYLHITGSPTAAGATYIRGETTMVHLDGCTLNGAGLIIAGDYCSVGGAPAAITAVNFITGLWVDVGVTVNPTAGSYHGIYFSNQGGATGYLDSLFHFHQGGCDLFFDFAGASSGAGHDLMEKMTGDHDFDGNDYALKCHIAGVDYWIPLIDALS